MGQIIVLNVDVMPCYSLLLMIIEPNGPYYEVPLNAQVLRPQPTTTSALLCNRHSVAFGGLQLGQSTYVLSFQLI